VDGDGTDDLSAVRSALDDDHDTVSALDALDWKAKELCR
jgi:hypothetical protein